jgi:hypothetical protein
LTAHFVAAILLATRLPAYPTAFQVIPMKRFQAVCVFSTIASAMLAAQSNPVTLIYQPLSPVAVQPGQPRFQLTVHGTGFVSGAVVRWNEKALQTRFVSSSKLKAVVPAAAIAKASTASVTVANPGVIASNVIYFSVRKPSSTVTLETGPQSVEGGQVVVGDFNNDQRPDILVKAADQFADVYLHGKNGNLVKVPGPEWGGTEFVLPTAADLTADFNGDGNLDASLCTNDGSVGSGCTIYLGDGKGGLTVAPGYASVGGIGSVADINHDGILDYVVSECDFSSCALHFYFGNGDGTFNTTGIGIPIASDSGSPVLGDFNGDGKIDLAVPLGNGMIGVLLGNGDGTFRRELDYPVTNSGALAVADVNGDGILDIVTNGVSVLLGKGDGTFTAGPSISVPSASTIHLADFNGDGKLDLVTVTLDSSFNQTMQILLGDGTGSFSIPITFAEGQSYWYPEIGIADLNNDGGLDFILGGQASSTVLLQK